MTTILNRLGAFAKAAKAFVPLAIYGVSEALHHGFDLHTPSGRQAFLAAALIAIVTYTVPNKTA